METQCRVCGWHTNRLIVQCSNCSDNVDVEGGSGTCATCDQQVDLNDLLEMFGAFDDHADPNEALAEEEIHAYCPECEYSENPIVVHLATDGYAQIANHYIPLLIFLVGATLM